MDKARSGKIIKILKRYYGDLAPSLTYNDLYQITIAVVLSAQTTDVQVNAVTPALFSRYPNFRALAQAQVQDVEKIIKSTGFYKNKARHIIRISYEIVLRHGGTPPDTIEKLMTLPGIGRKSANVILSMGFNKPAFAVDTHVLRVTNRLGYCITKNPLKAEAALTAIIPERDWISGHMIFITHGRKLCRARNPLCGECPVSHLCDALNNTGEKS